MEAGERRAAVWLAVVALAGLGVVVDAASTPALGQALAPALTAPAPFSPFAVGVFPWPAVATAAGFVVAVLLVRWWPAVLAVGAAATVPAALGPFFLPPAILPLSSMAVAEADLALAGAGMALVAVLGAAQEAVDGGRLGLGAAIAGATAGAALVGATLVGAGYLARPYGDLAVPHLVLALLGLLGGALAIVRRPQGPAHRPGVRVTVAGALAGLLALVPAVVTYQRVAAVLQVSLISLERRGYAMVAIVGLATLGLAVLLAAATGARAAAGAAAAALVQVGVVAPLVLVYFALAFTPTSGLAFALLGFAAGCALGATRWRAAYAVAGCVTSALALLLASAATGGLPEKIVTRPAWVPAGLLLALLVFTVTSTVATAALAAARRGGLPAVLGPIRAALVAGGVGTLTLTQLENGQADSTYLAGAHHLDSTVAVLLIAAAVVAWIGLRTRVRN